MNEEELRAFAVELAHKFIIADSHVDLPERLKSINYFSSPDTSIVVKTDKGDFDYERAKKGGLDAPFMSIYVPSSYQLQSDKGKGYADSLINMVESIAGALPNKFTLAKTAEDVEENFKAGKISFPMGLENGAPIGDDLSNIQYFRNRGISYITLTHGRNNQICDSSYDSTHTWNGLSTFGYKVVKEMNRVGIMVDISHVDDSTFYQVMKISEAPCIASHSSCRYFTPSFQRNMSDDMIKTLAANEGVIQINVGSNFLDSTVAKYNHENSDKLDALLKEKNLKSSDKEAEEITSNFWKQNQRHFADVEAVANHIDHVVKLVGINYVGIGSDFDGVGDSLPTGLKDVSMYPNLIYSLLKRGYSESDIEKICSGNLFRVWKQVVKLSESKKS